MNPLDRGTASPSPQQPSPQQGVQPSSPQQAGSSQQTDNSLQANIANVGAANAPQPATIPLAANASQFQSVPSYPNIMQSPAGGLFYLFNFSSPQVIPALSSQQNLPLATNIPLQRINAHKALLSGIQIPVFKYKLASNFISSESRLALQKFIKEVFTRLEGLECCYDRVNFISSLLLLADGHYKSLQLFEELNAVITPYIANPDENKYLQADWNIDWPNSRQVRETQDPQNYYVTNITLETKKSLYLKMAELDNATAREHATFFKRIRYVDAAFAYGVSPGVIKTWVRCGRQAHQAQVAAQQARSAGQLPRTGEQLPRAFEERPLASRQTQAATFNPGIIISDEQSPGPSRSTRTSATLRFEPYQRPQSQPLSQNLDIQHQAQTQGLTAEMLQAFNLNTELDAAFNNQMEALPWPSVTSAQFIQEEGSDRHVIAPATRMEIGRFIIENCLPDARVYKYAALRYGVALTDIVKWASEASE